MQATNESTIPSSRAPVPNLRALPWWQRAGFWCLPARCYFCDGRGDLGPLDLCGRCHRALPWLAVPHGSTAVISAFVYAAPVDTALKALKFAGDRAAARVLGALVAMAATRAIALERLRPPQLLVPVPLHPQRLADRGFNQAALLAMQIGRWLQRPVLRDGLVRTIATRPQTALSASERRDNVVGAFQLSASFTRQSASATHRGNTLRSVALIDDVSTTGATLEAARAALLQVGVEDVQLWSVATAIPNHTIMPT
ncbi:MAG: ComF family protein [Gammaproteobacteria bacterium]|nr:ComF family protein [Gammaproteobacteria bacterium]MBM4223396.1 ComF family protein [Gammaproteobacteria bacterium]